ncbi:MAG: DUF5615 family PIN-like protein [Dehalococcoidia bacterium]
MANVCLDNDMAIRVAGMLRADGHQAVTTRELGLARASDAELLLIAAQRSWVFVTHNADDFTLLDDGWRRWSAAWGVTAHHASILLLPQATPAERVRGRLDPVELAQHLIDLLDSGHPSSNELWQWQRAAGWVRLR